MRAKRCLRPSLRPSKDCNDNATSTSAARDKVGAVEDFSHIVRCFLPDLNKQDGSCDLVLGGDSDNGGQPTVRVIDSFVPAKR